MDPDFGYSWELMIALGYAFNLEFLATKQHGLLAISRDEDMTKYRCNYDKIKVLRDEDMEHCVLNTCYCRSEALATR